MKKLRQGTEADKALIYATWLRSTYYGTPYFKLIEKNTFFDNYKKIVEQRLINSSVLVCCLEEDPDVVLGYSLFTNNVLHWVYVKRAWRGLGIAKMLVPSTCDTATSLTKIGKVCNKGKLVFNPFN
jgi:GNAT superfamily N-acetyltransferase